MEPSVIFAQLSGARCYRLELGRFDFDLNNDGWKDLFVCNGISRDLTDQGFLGIFQCRSIAQTIRDQGFDFTDILKKCLRYPIQIMHLSIRKI